jgi:hypothetical protein
MEAAKKGRIEGIARMGSSPVLKTEKEAARVGTRGREEEERGRRRKESGGSAGEKRWRRQVGARRQRVAAGTSATRLRKTIGRG